MSDVEAGLREEAERRAQARMSVRVHAFVFVLVNGGLLGLDYLTDGRFDWAWWPMLGWGIGLAAHLIGVTYSLSGAHDRAVARELEFLRQRQRRD
ncbi:MAG TPA: 2TM domain-containing protein [Brevundimonas sp.]|jgi:hypothetical protein|uniref:2TM domain-containing protein n=1 Tax=Brevundimonas sp. TaxID=1871086 RepID=UPI002E132458|nr:2TM domain-containing protein [Brevundimonas sp.]